MPRAVRFNEYGDVEVLEVVDVPRPTPGSGQVLVAVKAAGINPLETSIRSGAMKEVFPTTFPAGQGLDLAGQVVELGEGVDGFTVGQDVVGFTENQSSHADYVLVNAADLVPKPANVSWEVAGGLYVVGTTAYAAVAAVGVQAGDTVVVSGAAGGVGSLAVQLAKHRGATVIGLASPANHDWLSAHGVIGVGYGDGVAERIRAAAGGTVDAFIDTFGADYIRLAIDLGVAHRAPPVSRLIEHRRFSGSSSTAGFRLIGHRPPTPGRRPWPPPSRRRTSPGRNEPQTRDRTSRSASRRASRRLRVRPP